MKFYSFSYLWKYNNPLDHDNGRTLHVENKYVQQIYLNCLVTNNEHRNSETFNNNRKKSRILG